MSNDTLTKKEARLVRWRILRTLYIGRPYPVTEEWMLDIICDSATHVSLRELRKEIEYLADESMGLVNVRKLRHDSDNRDIALTASGTDFVEYHAPDVEGIGRPRHATEI